MQEAVVVVTAGALPSGYGEIVALLAPADNRLTLRESCYSNRLTGTQATFSYVPPGKYRIFVVDADPSQDVAAYATRSLNFLKDEATSIETPEGGQIEVMATYVDRETVKAAIRRSRTVPKDPR